MDGLQRRKALLRSASEGEIDHHDRILLHDADGRMMPTSEINDMSVR